MICIEKKYILEFNSNLIRLLYIYGSLGIIDNTIDSIESQWERKQMDCDLISKD